MENISRITSRKNPAVMHAASLSEKKYRDEAREFLIEGEKLINEALMSDLCIKSVFICEDECDKIAALVEKIRKDKKYSKIPLYLLPRSCYNKISEEKSCTSVAAVVKYLDNSKRINSESLDEIISPSEMLMMICSLRDPGNVGTVIRSAAAFGYDGVILAGGCADIYNRKTIRAAMGSIFRIKTYVIDDPKGAAEALRKQGRRVFCAELRPSAVCMDSIDFLSTDVAIVGNEGHGIPEEVSSVSGGSFYIPISQSVESLNAATAASIITFTQSRTKQ